MKVLLPTCLLTACLLTHLCAQTPPNTQPQNASGAIVSSVQKKLGWHLTLSQREAILDAYANYLKTSQEDVLIEEISQLTKLSPPDVNSAIKKYLAEPE